ncbi:MAG TPA: hypothetical protein VE594_01200 [Nitrososphaeraceae archaeon]|nr:hypothetical protein [Nitrososphaeraceae archaeon]
MEHSRNKLINKRILLTISFGILVTAIVFFGLQDSQNRPSLSRLPISPEIAILKVENTFNISENQIGKSPNYVYVKSDGNVFESNPELNSIGDNIGITEPTTTGGSHFAWEIDDFLDKHKYYVDSVIAEIISNSSYK